MEDNNVICENNNTNDNTDNNNNNNNNRDKETRNEVIITLSDAANASNLRPPIPSNAISQIGTNMRNRRNLPRNNDSQGYDDVTGASLMYGDTDSIKKSAEYFREWMSKMNREQLVVISAALMLIIFMVVVMFYNLYESSNTLSVLFVDDNTPVKSLPPAPTSDLVAMIDVDSHRYMSAKVDSRRADSHLVKIMENNHAVMHRSDLECIYPNMYDTAWNVLTLRNSRVSYINTRFVPIGVPERVVKIKGTAGDHRIVKVYSKFNLTFDAAFRSAGDRVYLPIFYADVNNVVSFDATKGSGQETVGICIQSYHIK